MEEATSFATLVPLALFLSGMTLAASQTVRVPPCGKLFSRMPAFMVAVMGVVHFGSPAISGLLSFWNGKALATKVPLGGWTSKLRSPPRWLGLIWFLTRLSAAAWAWQDPQDCTASLPTCISQNSDLPNTAARFRFRT